MNSNDNFNQSQSILSSQKTNKRKTPPTKNQKKKKKKILDNTIISTIDSQEDTDNVDRTNPPETNVSSSV